MSTEVIQLKTPNGKQSNFRFRIDGVTGQLAVANDAILSAVRVAGAAGISTKQVAIAVLGVGDPKQAQVEKVRRRLKALGESGSLTTVGAGASTRWVEP